MAKIKSKSRKEKGYQKTVLAAWSGGIDSTYILSRILEETDHHVIAMHISMYDQHDRYQREAEAVESLYVKLSRVRPFDLVTIGMDFRQLADSKPFDMSCVGFGFGVVARDLMVKGHQVDELIIGTHEREGHWQKRWDVIKKTIDVHFESANFPYDPLPLMLLDPLPTKKEEMEYLRNHNLLYDCWFCRKPVEDEESYRPCGECATCDEVNEATL